MRRPASTVGRPRIRILDDGDPGAARNLSFEAHAPSLLRGDASYARQVARAAAGFDLAAMLNRFRARLVWQLGGIVALVSLVFAVVWHLGSRADEARRRALHAAQIRSREEAIGTIVGLRGLAMANYVGDYSLWSDMAAFATAPDPKWAATNVDASLGTFKVSHAWVFDGEGRLAYHASTGAKLAALPGQIANVRSLFVERALVHYFARLADGTLMEVRGARIQREDDAQRTSEALGYFVAATRWDDAYLQQFRPLLGGRPWLVEGAASCPTPEDDDGALVVGHVLAGRLAPAGTLCVELRDEAAALTAASSRSLIVLPAGFAFALFLMLSVSLHVLVTRPVRRIRNAITTGDTRALCGLEQRPNEFGELARAVLDHRRGMVERDRLREQVFQSGKLAALGVLGAGVAHELNNPLAAVLGNAELLQDALAVDPVDRDEARESASVILAQAERMRRIVDHVRQLSRSERGPTQVTQVEVDRVVEDELSSLRRRLEAHGIHLELRLSAPHQHVHCEKALLESVVHNLVRNAADELERLPPGRARNIVVRTDLDASTRVVSLSIADDGPGIAKDVSERIFEPFFTTKPVGRGTGLGLSLVHAAVTQSGGAVTFETSAQGTTFFVAFPAADAPLECDRAA